MKKNMNPFHMTSPSPWPLITSMTMLSMTIMILNCMSKNNLKYQSILIMSTMLISNMFMWWRDVKRESSFQGNHSMTTMNMMKLSMMMFIMSEIMFFVSFFWAFFHSSISPGIELGMNWPPKETKTFNPMSMPLMNSLILLSSGASITWSHHLFLNKNLLNSIKTMIITILMGIMFTSFQIVEYYNSHFSISDSSYGSVFFLSTGFHGIHVIVGTIFLMNTLSMMMSMSNSTYHFISFELSAWYWHFVDVIWLVLYMTIYWWGSN